MEPDIYCFYWCTFNSSLVDSRSMISSNLARLTYFVICWNLTNACMNCCLAMFSDLRAHKDMTMFYWHVSAININSLLSLGHSLTMYSIIYSSNDVTVSSCCFVCTLVTYIIKIQYCITVCYCILTWTILSWRKNQQFTRLINNPISTIQPHVNQVVLKEGFTCYRKLSKEHLLNRKKKLLNYIKIRINHTTHAFKIVVLLKTTMAASTAELTTISQHI